MAMARTGFYPGSFDPLTYGHLDIIARASRLVDRLVIGIGVHHGKQAMLFADERTAILKTVTQSIAEHTGLEIAIVTFDDLAVDAARRHGAGIVVRGLRDASPATRMIASSLVRQIARMGGDISLFVPHEALEAVLRAVKA
jgi:pantetheine-phosphate adenylyltransferase